MSEKVELFLKSSPEFRNFKTSARVGREELITIEGQLYDPDFGLFSPLKGGMPNQPVDIYANERYLMTVTTEAEGKFKTTVPAKMFSPGIVRFQAKFKGSMKYNPATSDISETLILEESGTPGHVVGTPMEIDWAKVGLYGSIIASTGLLTLVIIKKLKKR